MNKQLVFYAEALASAMLTGWPRATKRSRGMQTHAETGLTSMQIVERVAEGYGPDYMPCDNGPESAFPRYRVARTPRMGDVVNGHTITSLSAQLLVMEASGIKFYRRGLSDTWTTPDGQQSIKL